MSNVHSLEAARRQSDPPAASTTPSIPEFIKPRTIADMTETEADAYLMQLRDRRMQMAARIREHEAMKAEIASAAARQKIEKKAAQCKRAEEAVLQKLDKLEELVHQLRALQIQYE